MTIRLEAIAIGVEAIVTRLGAIAISLGALKCGSALLAWVYQNERDVFPLQV